MKKTTRVIGSVGALALAAGLFSAAPASASGCVTKTEYYAIKNGQTIRQVVKNTGADFVSWRHHIGSDGYSRDTFVFPTCPNARKSWGKYISVFTKDTKTKVFVVTGKIT